MASWASFVQTKPGESWKPRRKVMMGAVAALVAIAATYFGWDADTSNIVIAAVGVVLTTYIFPGEKLAQAEDPLPPPIDPANEARF